MKAPAKSTALPPPVGGWDTENALADMPPQNAVVLDNWFPTTDTVILRRGFEAHATGMSGNVDSLLEYTATDGTEEMFAGNGTSIFDVTSAGAVGAAVVGSLTNVRFQQAQIGTAAGSFLIAVNGADTPVLYNGTSWSTASITGPTAANLVWINLHQRRLWFGEVNSLKAWYLAVNSNAGAALSFDLSGIAKRGGYIMAMGTWTRDSGDGADDVAVFVTSEGEAVVYQGTDPSSATTWALVGVFRIGVPIGRRCFTKAGSDLILITEDGFVSVSTILQLDRSQAQRGAISAQINKAVNDAVRSGATLYGWEPFIYPRGTMLIFNVPQSTTVSHQYVFNTITEKPCRFTGMNARCWGLLNDNPYFGGTDGKVYKADSGASDNGNNIVGDAVQAFNDFRYPGRLKAFKMIEILMIANGVPTYAVGLNLDYKLTKLTTGPISVSSTTAGGVWGAGLWGAAVWGSSNQLFRGWRTVSGIGYSAAIRLRVDTKTARPAWMASNLIYVPGGAL
jgi:hypothetical protein